MRNVIITYRFLAAPVRNGQDDVKTENPEGTAQEDFGTFIVRSYFDTLLSRYTVTYCGAVVLKVMDQKTVVKGRGVYKVRLTVYI